VQRGGLGTSVGDGQADEDVVRRRLGVLDDDVEVAVIVKHPGVEQLILRRVLPATTIFFDEPGVRELRLRIFVEGFHVGVGGRGVEIEIAFLDVLAMVAFRTGESEEPFFEDRIAAVPEGQ
jgi:hypothetical protein